MSDQSTKTIQQVGESLGIPAKETDAILEGIRANDALIDSCSGHDFSICIDRHTKQPIETPTPSQRFGAKWKCSKCGGVVDTIDKNWYNRGTASLQSRLTAAEQERDEAQSEHAGCITRWREALTSPIPAQGGMREPAESLYRQTEALRMRITALENALREAKEALKQCTALTNDSIAAKRKALQTPSALNIAANQSSKQLR